MRFHHNIGSQKHINAQHHGYNKIINKKNNIKNKIFHNIIICCWEKHFLHT